MQISELETQTRQWVANEIKNGGRFVTFSYTISVVIMTFRRPSDVYFLRNGESPLKHRWSWRLISLFLGWWGFPFGPIHTIKSLYDGFTGIDITADVLGTDKELSNMIFNE